MDRFPSRYRPTGSTRPKQAIEGFLGSYSTMINALEFQRDIQEWLNYLLRVASVYPLRFAAAAGLVLLVIGLLTFGLARGTEQNQAAEDWVLAEIRARRRRAALITLFCIAGITLGVHFARFKFAAHPAPSKQEMHVARNPADRVKVWEDPRHGVYHCSGSSWFGKTTGGKMATLRQAQYEGYRPNTRPCPVNQTGQPQLAAND